MPEDAEMKDVPQEEVKNEAKDEAKEEPKDEAKEEPKDEPKEEEKEEAKEESKEEPKEETGEAMEDVKQEELDAPEDKRPRVAADAVFLNMTDATANAMLTGEQKILMPLCDGGLQYLLAGVRCSVGLKAGRYFFETRIVETLNPAEQRASSRTPTPRQLVRLGVSLNASSNLLDDSSEKAYFDSEGYFTFGRKRTRAASHFGRDQVVGLLINIDSETRNANTLSLFRDGERISDPQPLPENLVGKTLYPCITWKNYTLHVNLGPNPKKPLPFTCRMLKDAAAADVEMTAANSAGKNEVLFPIGLPEQGLFDWLDMFLEKNPHYFELSDRKILEWAQQSGVYKQQGSRSKYSVDKPGMNFGIPVLDDESVKKTISVITPALRRDFVHMELKSNLIEKERKAALANFPSNKFKKVAVVAVGEPSEDFKAKVLEWTLKDKEEKVKWEKYREERKKRWEPETKEAEKKEKEKEKEKEKDEKEGDGEEKKDQEKVEEGDDAPKESEAKDGEKESDEKKEDMEVEDEDKPVELTEEEKKIWYYKHETPDLNQSVLAKSFAGFSLPTKEEGFDEIRYVWQPEDKCAAHVKAWMLDLKKTHIAEDLEPSTWFKEKFKEWTKVLSDWRRKHNDTRDIRRLKKEEKKDEGDKAEDKDGSDDEKNDAKEEKEVDAEPEVDKVEDINDIGDGMPLFANFVYEDWTLLSLRYELHLLVHAFKRDLDDPDRPGFSEAHLAFYYNKYFKKEFTLKWYDMKELAELVELLKDTLVINGETGFLESILSADEPMDKFVRLTEENRRERQRCIDAGDETADLKFQRPTISRPEIPPLREQRSEHRGGDQYRDRGGPVGGSRGPPTRGGPPPRSSYQGGSSKGSGYSSGASRSNYNPPPPSSRSYGGTSSHGSKRPLAPPAPSYPSKQPRYGGSSSAPASRSSYAPQSSGYSSRYR